MDLLCFVLVESGSIPAAAGAQSAGLRCVCSRKARTNLRCNVQRAKGELPGGLSSSYDDEQPYAGQPLRVNVDSPLTARNGCKNATLL
jgi:hypothetical protein